MVIPSQKPVCLVLHADEQLCKEIDRGIAQCVSDRFDYRYANTVEEVHALLQTIEEEGHSVTLLLLDLPSTYKTLIEAHPAFADIAYGYIDSQKDDFYADITNLRSRMREHPELEDLEAWDKTRFIACLERSLNPAADRYHENDHVDEGDEDSPLAGLNTHLEHQIDPATLLQAPVATNGKSVTAIRKISTAISEMQLRRDRRREVEVPVTDAPAS